MPELDRSEALRRYGVDPAAVGGVDWWVVRANSFRREESWAGAWMGDLCIKTVGTRDHSGTLNPKDPAITSLPNFRSTTVDGWDETIRYYYLAPLPGR